MPAARPSLFGALPRNGKPIKPLKSAHRMTFQFEIYSFNCANLLP